jgi:hypothetical protein
MKRKLFVEAIRVVLKTLLETHTYNFAGEIRRQKEGGAIGMELTGVVAQIFMVWWDRQLTEKLREINIALKLHERYVDDTNILTKQVELGEIRWGAHQHNCRLKKTADLKRTKEQ